MFEIEISAILRQFFGNLLLSSGQIRAFYHFQRLLGGILSWGIFLNLGQNAKVLTRTVVTLKTCIIPCVLIMYICLFFKCDLQMMKPLIAREKKLQRELLLKTVEFAKMKDRCEKSEHNFRSWITFANQLQPRVCYIIH